MPRTFNKCKLNQMTNRLVEDSGFGLFQNSFFNIEIEFSYTNTSIVTKKSVNLLNAKVMQCSTNFKCLQIVAFLIFVAMYFVKG